MHLILTGEGGLPGTPSLSEYGPARSNALSVRAENRPLSTDWISVMPVELDHPDVGGDSQRANGCGVTKIFDASAATEHADLSHSSGSLFATTADSPGG